MNMTQATTTTAVLTIQLLYEILKPPVNIALISQQHISKYDTPRIKVSK